MVYLYPRKIYIPRKIFNLQYDLIVVKFVTVFLQFVYYNRREGDKGVILNYKTKTNVNDGQNKTHWTRTKSLGTQVVQMVSNSYLLVTTVVLLLYIFVWKPNLVINHRHLFGSDVKRQYSIQIPKISCVRCKDMTGTLWHLEAIFNR